MATRSKHKYLELLSESFGPQHLKVSDIQSYQQSPVQRLLLSHMNRLSGGDKFRQKKIKRKAAIAVQEQVSFHYQNSNITTISKHKMSEKISNFYGEFQRAEWLPKGRKKSVFNPLLHPPHYSEVFFFAAYSSESALITDIKCLFYVAGYIIHMV